MALKVSSDVIILQDSFFLYPAVSIVCNLKLKEKCLIVEYPNKSKNEYENILLQDIVGCHVMRGKTHKSRNGSKDLSAYFCVYSYPLKTSGGILGKQLKRERRAFTFQIRKFNNQEDNLKESNKWRRAILWLLKGKKIVEHEEMYMPATLPSSQKLLILVNPRSGPGRAHQIFKERVVPLLAESDTLYELLVTDRANCARDYMKIADLSQWDGIVVVSGDGLLFEVYNGLMARSDWKKAVKMPIGAVPGGSGNGLARAINYAAGEPYDVTVVTPSVLNIIRGRVAPMDLVHVQTTKETVYSFLSIGWGLMADIDIESERLRAFGEARFTVWAVIRALGLRKYKGKLSYLPVTGYEPKSSKTVIEPKPKRSKTLDIAQALSEDPNHSNNLNDCSNAMFRSKSFGTHGSVIEEDKLVRLVKFSYSGEYAESLSFPEQSNLLSDNSLSQEFDLNDAQNIPHTHCDPEEGKENIPVSEDDSANPQKTIPKHLTCPPLEDPVPDNWVVIEDEFVMVYACHQTHLSTDVLFAPDARMDDGIMWLIVIRSAVSRAQVMYFLSCLQTGDHVHIPYVEVTPIHAFRLEPALHDSFLTVDGEVIPCTTIQADVLPSIARVMSR